MLHLLGLIPVAGFWWLLVAVARAMEITGVNPLIVIEGLLSLIETLCARVGYYPFKDL